LEQNTNIVKSFLLFSKSQRVGVMLLFLIICLLQTVYFFVDFNSNKNDETGKSKWLANQTIIDSLKQQKETYKTKAYPFNPNFITDFKGYKLGMSVTEMDRLLAFRKLDKYVNSAEEFQKVTKISNSLLKTMSPYFKFPDWVNNKHSNFKTFENKDFSKKEVLKVLDINQASKEDLMKVYGIGNGLSERIVKQKEAYGGFVSMEQMDDVWGLSPEVVENLKTHFKVSERPNVKKININNASVKELTYFHNFGYTLAKEIVTYRTMKGDIKVEDLTKIKDFPVEKIKIIALYLDF
jgi:DNA uptake protein ComE-like DNA-binding protein